METWKLIEIQVLSPILESKYNVSIEAMVLVCVKERDMHHEKETIHSIFSFDLYFVIKLNNSLQR